MSAPVDISQIVDGLASRAEDLARELLPAGHREGAEWVEAKRAQGGLGDSLKVHLIGTRAGVWCHFGAGRRAGDALDLVAYILFAGDKKMAVRWARGWLGIDDGQGGKQANGVRFTRRRARPIDRAAQAQKDAAKRSGQAFRLWLEGQERLAGTVAALYLRRRGLDLARLGRQPRALRFHPNCLDGASGRRYPALLAAVVGADGKCVAVHRTFLTPHGDKAMGAESKKVFGPYGGGAIRLWRGERVDPETGEVKPGWPLAQARAGSSVVITEGIEDGLSVALAAPERRVLVAVALGNMGRVALPDTVSQVLLCADNDGANAQAAAALDKAIGQHLAAGRDVRLVRSPVGKDLNDALRGAA